MLQDCKIFTWVESREASVISRLPLRPSRAGTNTIISVNSVYNGQAWTASKSIPAPTIPKPAMKNGTTIVKTILIRFSGFRGATSDKVGSWPHVERLRCGGAVTAASAMFVKPFGSVLSRWNYILNSSYHSNKITNLKLTLTIRFQIFLYCLK